MYLSTHHPEDLPSGLKKITFGGRFTQEFEEDTLPRNLETLGFKGRSESGGSFTQITGKNILPKSLKTLNFDSNPVNNNTKLVCPDKDLLPSGLLHLTLGVRFNRKLKSLLPNSLKKLSFDIKGPSDPEYYREFRGAEGSQNRGSASSKSSKELDSCFDQEIGKGDLPKSLEILDFGWHFNNGGRQFAQGVFSDCPNLKEIYFGKKFNQPLRVGLFDQRDPDGLDGLI